jgi:hypothetical protein
MPRSWPKGAGADVVVDEDAMDVLKAEPKDVRCSLRL